ncbi:MAG: DUF805 domain-containing protein [Pseudomonadota bacterium]
MTDRTWYYANNNQKQGPIDQTKLTELAASGTIQPETLVWTDGMSNWEAASSVFPKYGINPDAPGQVTGAPPIPAGTSTGFDTGQHPTTFVDSVKKVFNNYANFKGRARRSEFWYFTLFTFLTSLILTAVDIGVLASPDVSPLSTLFSLGILIPSLAVGARRLHDIGRTGWWQLLIFVPLLGLIVLIFLYVQKSEENANQYGPA